MKKTISILLVYGVILMSLLFSGCASNTDQITDINVAEENDTSKIISENEAPNNTTEADVVAKMKDAATLCFENIIGSILLAFKEELVHIRRTIPMVIPFRKISYKVTSLSFVPFFTTSWIIFSVS